MADLAGRVALVTGAARGIGAAAARALAGAGASVMLTDVLEDAGRVVAAGIIERGGHAIFRRQDVTRENEWTETVAATVAEFGGLDVLVNNAGILLIRPLLETSLDDFRKVQAVNVEGTFLGIKAALPAIAERGERWAGGGSIVNMSSLGGIVGSPSAIAYCGSKGAIRLMTKAAALECVALGKKVRVNSVHPGRVDTDMLREAMRGLEGTARPSNVAVGSAEDIANAIVFLAGDGAAFMNGSEMVVDGAFTAQ